MIKHRFSTKWLFVMGLLTAIHVIGFLSVLGLLPTEARNALMIFPNSIYYLLDEQVSNSLAMGFVFVTVLLATCPLAYWGARADGYSILILRILVLVFILAFVGFLSTYAFMIS